MVYIFFSQLGIKKHGGEMKQVIHFIQYKSMIVEAKKKVAVYHVQYKVERKRFGNIMGTYN